jgi:glutamine amidotransferase
MCRLTLYKGRPILIGDLVIEPENSLLYQSRDAGYHPGVIDKTNERNILVNGDGFGISWYGENPTKGSCCFKFVTPAWSDTNLRNIGKHVSSPLIFAHVRAAASGHDRFAPMIVSNENCHPFTYKSYTFMHNGGIPCFQKIKLKILNLLSPETFSHIKGTTDTEHIFAIFLNCLPPDDVNKPHTLHDMINAINQTISVIIQLCRENNIKEDCSLNLCVSNGYHVIATRFRTGLRSPPSLYYNFGSNFVCENGNFYALGESEANEIVISSAPLSKVCGLEEQSVAEAEADCQFNYYNARNYSQQQLDELSPSVGGASFRTQLSGGAATPSASGGRSRAGTGAGSAPPLPPLPPPLYSSATHHTSGVRPSVSFGDFCEVRARSSSTASVRALACAGCGADAEQNSAEGDNNSDCDVGAWILIPKNHMLVCKADESNAQRVERVYLEPITVAVHPGLLSQPLYQYSAMYPNHPNNPIRPGYPSYPDQLSPSQQQVCRSPSSAAVTSLAHPGILPPHHQHQYQYQPPQPPLLHKFAAAAEITTAKSEIMPPVAGTVPAVAGATGATGATGGDASLPPHSAGHLHHLGTIPENPRAAHVHVPVGGAHAGGDIAMQSSSTSNGAVSGDGEGLRVASSQTSCTAAANSCGSSGSSSRSVSASLFACSLEVGTGGAARAGSRCSGNEEDGYDLDYTEETAAVVDTATGGYGRRGTTGGTSAGAHSTSTASTITSAGTSTSSSSNNGSNGSYRSNQAPIPITESPQRKPKVMKFTCQLNK